MSVYEFFTLLCNNLVFFLITDFGGLSSLEVLHRHTYMSHVFSECIIKLHRARLSSVVSEHSTGHSFVHSSMSFLGIRGWVRFCSVGGSDSIVCSNFSLMYNRLFSIDICSKLYRIDCCTKFSAAELLILWYFHVYFCYY
jgi:hypothetical protein